MFARVHIALFLLTLALAGCGGGGGSGDQTPAPPPNQDRIEFVLDVSHAGGTTTVTVTPGPNGPTGNCIVFNASDCAAPSDVAVRLDGGVRPLLRIAAPGDDEQQVYRYSVATESLGPGPHGVHVRVDTPQRSRQGWVGFEDANAAQAGFLGAFTEPAGLNAFAIDAPLNSARVGTTVKPTAMPVAGVQPVMRLVQAPLGSTAALVVDPQDAWSADLKLDRIGQYVIEYVPVFADGRTASPTYLTVVSEPFEIAMAWRLALNWDETQLPAYPDRYARLSVIALAREPRRIASVEAFLEGAPLGRLTAPNIGDYQGHPAPTSPPNFAQPAYAFDFPWELLGGDPKFLRLVVTDSSGFQAVDEDSIRFLERGGGRTVKDPSPNP